MKTSSRIWGSVVVVLIVAGIAAYFAGTVVERSAYDKDAAAAQQQISAVKADLETSKAKIASLQSINHLLSANVWVYRAAAALDNRNFGVANDAITKATGELNNLDVSAAGLDAKSVTALQKEAAGIKVSVATNLGLQRGRILRLAADISALAGKASPTP